LVLTIVWFQYFTA